ncbi:unnamed protein product [Sphenostylis stenocarpa]|uniref:F-box domain-containing protein n=1 Tax=Sphenostylis stenocarpa TaxID=92480 RepID=A0AA86VRW1_9FABA|nr:unnamed protein product [Sphenostylis stenocarpa]
MEFEGLAEGCVTTILSHTTPVDACRLSLVSNLFRSAAYSDAVWERFLPADYSSIISQCSLSNYPSKKALYLALSDRPVIFDNGRKSLQLEKKSGKKSLMLSARALGIVWGESEDYWSWTTHPDSSHHQLADVSAFGILMHIPDFLYNSLFPEVVELEMVCWLEIRGVLNTLTLSPNTQYAAYFVFKTMDVRGFANSPVELAVNFLGDHGSTKIVCLDPRVQSSRNNRVAGLQRPNIRSDGWLEIEMGEFFNTTLENEVEMSVTEAKGGNWKSGLVVEGIELRPKYEN